MQSNVSGGLIVFSAIVRLINAAIWTGLASALIAPVLAAEMTDELSDVLPEVIKINVRNFEFTGDIPVAEKKLQSVLIPYKGEGRSIDTLQRAQQALTSELQKQGYNFYRVSAPPQELSDGNVTIHIKKYTIESIVVQGNESIAAAEVRKSLPFLAEGKSPNTNRLALNLRLVNQNPSRDIKVSMSRGSEKGLFKSTVIVDEGKRHSVTANVNNTGSAQTGEYRFGIAYQHYDVFNRGHIVGASVATSPTDVNEVQQIGLNYLAPIPRALGTISLFAISSNINSGRVAEVFDVSGSGEIFGLGYTQLLPDVGIWKQQASLQWMDKLFDNEIDFSGEPIGIDVRSRPLTLGYRIDREENRKRVSLYAQASMNTNGGNLNTPDDYQLSRAGASQDWQKVEAGMSFGLPVRNLFFQGYLHLSQSADRLITGENFGVGGARYGRGLEERELTGDKGLRAGVQLWLPTLSTGISLGGFLDYGKVSVNKPNEGEFDNEDVLTTGISLQWHYRPADITLQMHAGYVLDGIESSETASQEGDAKLHFSLSQTW